MNANQSSNKKMKSFSHIGIFNKKNDNRIEPALKRLYHYLKQANKTIYLDSIGAKLLQKTVDNEKNIIHNIDLAIVIGGDGTLLGIGRDLAYQNIPILGINLGRLGFLTDISTQQMIEQLDHVFSGHFIEERRLMLDGKIYRGKQQLNHDIAINDIVIHVRMEIRMIEFTTHINNAFVNKQRADGMIISTPTGSTAYAMSSGGPIVHPELEAIILVPICPHSLSHRPIVIQASDSIEIELCNDERNPDARISFDAQNNVEIIPGDRIIITPLKKRLRLIHPTTNDYYKTLRTKLHWSMQP